MILRRIAESIKKQDWFVVLLEILVVVVGIFIALQVEDMNEKWQAKNKSDETIRQLIVDVKQAIVLTEEYINVRNGRIENGTYVLQILKGMNLTSENITRFEEGLEGITSASAPPINVGLVGSLLSGEVITVVNEPSIQTGILKVESKLIVALDVIDKLAYRLFEPSNLIRRFFGVKISHLDIDASYNIEEMRKSSEFVNTVQSSISQQLFIMFYARDIKESLNEFLVILEHSG